MKKLIPAILLLSWIACGTPSIQENTESQVIEHHLEDADWLLGNWINHTTSRSLNESWTKQNDSVFLGLGTFMDGQDTLSSEHIRLEQFGNRLFYVPVVSNQNQGQPVRFEMKEKSDKHLLFENMNHDFPQHISYTLITADSLVAKISGNMDGKYHEQDFPFQRLQANTH